MTKLYKLTTQEYKTRVREYNETQWGPNITHTAVGKSNYLCNDSWIHAYIDPNLAILLNPCHANINNPVLWECDGVVGKRDRQIKVGCTSLTTIRRIAIPKWSIEEKVKFAIYCTLEVYQEEVFIKWAHNWLNNIDRTAAAAYAADYAAANAAYAAANAANAADAADYAADYAAANAANAAANAADYAANTAANAADYAAYNAAYNAANVAANVANAPYNAAAKGLDLLAIIKKIKS